MCLRSEGIHHVLTHTSAGLSADHRHFVGYSSLCPKAIRRFGPNRHAPLVVGSNRFPPVRYHVAYSDASWEVTPPSFPLPPYTAFRYRSSHVQAAYYSRLAPEEVVGFYAALIPKEDLQEPLDRQTGAGNLSVLYQGVTYSITLTREGRGTRMLVAPEK